MTPESVAEILRQALLTALWVGAPLLLIGFAAGIVMSLVQIVTSIQDSAFNAAAMGPARIAGFVFSEAAFGITVGLALSFITEALIFGAQAVSMQAGFSYASTVDPTTQADSSVMAVFAQLGASLLFFAL